MTTFVRILLLIAASWASSAFGQGLDLAKVNESLDKGETVTLGSIWIYSDSTVGGFNHVHWDGDDLSEHAAPDGAYWAIVHVNGGDAYNLAFWSQGEEPPNQGNCGHIEADGLFVERDGVTLVTEWRGTQHGSIQVPQGESASGLELLFLPADSTAFAVADTCPENHLSWTLADTTIASVRLEPGQKWAFTVLGKRAGSTTLVLSAWHQQHIHLSSLPIPVVVSSGAIGRMAASAIRGGTAASAHRLGSSWRTEASS